MLKRHSVFYNTEPQIGSLINGVVIGLEEQRALGQEEIDDEFCKWVEGRADGTF